jgi:hypothetical protein
VPNKLDDLSKQKGHDRFVLIDFIALLLSA